jgi:hypothetical protein
MNTVHFGPRRLSYTILSFNTFIPKTFIATITDVAIFYMLEIEQSTK